MILHWAKWLVANRRIAFSVHAQFIQYYLGGTILHLHSTHNTRPGSYIYNNLSWHTVICRLRYCGYCTSGVHGSSGGDLGPLLTRPGFVACDVVCGGRGTHISQGGGQCAVIYTALFTGKRGGQMIPWPALYEKAIRGDWGCIAPRHSTDAAAMEANKLPRWRLTSCRDGG